MDTMIISKLSTINNLFEKQNDAEYTTNFVKLFKIISLLDSETKNGNLTAQNNKNIVMSCINNDIETYSNIISILSLIAEKKTNLILIPEIKEKLLDYNELDLNYIIKSLNDNNISGSIQAMSDINYSISDELYQNLIEKSKHIQLCFSNSDWGNLYQIIENFYESWMDITGKKTNLIKKIETGTIATWPILVLALEMSVRGLYIDFIKNPKTKPMSAKNESVAKPSAKDESMAKPSAKDESMAKPSAKNESMAKPSVKDESMAKPSAKPKKIKTNDETISNPAKSEVIHFTKLFAPIEVQNDVKKECNELRRRLQLSNIPDTGKIVINLMIDRKEYGILFTGNQNDLQYLADIIYEKTNKLGKETPLNSLRSNLLKRDVPRWLNNIGFQLIENNKECSLLYYFHVECRDTNYAIAKKNEFNNWTKLEGKEKFKVYDFKLIRKFY